MAQSESKIQKVPISPTRPRQDPSLNPSGRQIKTSQPKACAVRNCYKADRKTATFPNTCLILSIVHNEKKKAIEGLQKFTGS